MGSMGCIHGKLGGLSLGLRSHIWGLGHGQGKCRGGLVRRGGFSLPWLWSLDFSCEVELGFDGLVWFSAAKSVYLYRWNTLCVLVMMIITRRLLHTRCHVE